MRINDLDGEQCYVHYTTSVTGAVSDGGGLHLREQPDCAMLFCLGMKIKEFGYLWPTRIELFSRELVHFRTDIEATFVSAFIFNQILNSVLADDGIFVYLTCLRITVVLCHALRSVASMFNEIPPDSAVGQPVGEK